MTPIEQAWRIVNNFEARVKKPVFAGGRCSCPYCKRSFKTNHGGWFSNAKIHAAKCPKRPIPESVKRAIKRIGAAMNGAGSSS